MPISDFDHYDDPRRGEPGGRDLLAIVPLLAVCIVAGFAVSAGRRVSAAFAGLRNRAA